jgi:hypothetical protein
MSAVGPILVLQLGLVCVPIVCALWVLTDARARARAGHPVGVYFRNLQIETPELWAICCALLWVLVLPLYLRARSES